MTTYEQRGTVNLWWFPKDFSQSRYGEYCSSGRNSCTLISLLVANAISYEREFLMRADRLPGRAVDIFATAINDGNAVYHELECRIDMEKRHSRNLNIPDAIRALKQYYHKKCSFQLKELLFTHLMADSTKHCYAYVVAERLTKIFQIGLQLYEGPMQPLSGSSSTSSGLQSRYKIMRKRNKSRSSSSGVKRTQKRKASLMPDLHPVADVALSPSPALTTRYLFALVIADSRTSTLVFEVPNNMVAFIDSHHHGRNTGAAIAQATTRNLNDLSYWFVTMLEKVYSSRPELYEISFFATQEIDTPPT